MKVPNRVLNTVLSLINSRNSSSVPPPSEDDVKFVAAWASEGINKRAKPAAAEAE